MVGEDGEMTENRGGTRDEQTERGMWRQRYGWIKRGKEFQGEIQTEEGGGGGGTYGSDYEPMMSCVYVR